MSRTVSADSAAPPDAVWRLYARPKHWKDWSPHIRGAWGLGTPEVEAGRRGFVRLLGVPLVPARILKVTQRTWVWRVGPVTMTHGVRALPGGGSRITLTFDAPGPIEPAVAAAYGPVCKLLLARLARVAASDSSGTS
jgi:hypothetical protein